jgi:ABC-type lipoprotein export system ATPase subunit
MTTTQSYLPTDHISAEFFHLNHLPVPVPCTSIEKYWGNLPWQQQELGGWTLESLEEGLSSFLTARSGSASKQVHVRTLEILAGRDKDGNPESYDLCFRPGEIICIVGPTGSGKSRFLEDIECMAQGDTPSRRRVLINGRAPEAEWRFSGESRIVAQISQNMNFIMDLPVSAFVRMHAESRCLDDPEGASQRVLDAAVAMAGEPFHGSTPLTQLSGGQSRALMIADAALLSPKPVVLIDEIENAGVDRTRALNLFVEKGKIVFLSTHDPLLALSGTRRLVISRGAVVKIVTPSPLEKNYGERLARFDHSLSELREALRRGDSLDTFWSNLRF